VHKGLKVGGPPGPLTSIAYEDMPRMNDIQTELLPLISHSQIQCHKFSRQTNTAWTDKVLHYRINILYTELYTYDTKSPGTVPEPVNTADTRQAQFCLPS